MDFKIRKLQTKVTVIKIMIGGGKPSTKVLSNRIKTEEKKYVLQDEMQEITRKKTEDGEKFKNKLILASRATI